MIYRTNYRVVASLLRRQLFPVPLVHAASGLPLSSGAELNLPPAPGFGKSAAALEVARD